MALTPKVGGQINPTAATLTTGYTVPASTVAVVNIFVVNRSAIATSFRVSVAVAGAADDLKQYIAYDQNIIGNAMFPLVGIALGPTDVIRVYATLATLSFNIMAIESA